MRSFRLPGSHLLRINTKTLSKKSIANKLKPKSSTLPGKTWGLQLRIGPLKSENMYPVTFSTGLKVLINNQTFTPNFDDNSRHRHIN